MTQPAPKTGPITIGGSETFGNSTQGVYGTLMGIQQSARGCAEWIDGLATGTGQAPQFAHDHRGGIWGRPLGVCHSLAMEPFNATGTVFRGVTFLNVPNVSSPNGDAFPSIETNGGYQYADLYCYHSSVAGNKTIAIRTSYWENGLWSTPSEDSVLLTAPGGGAAWTQAESFQLPAGLVKIEVINVNGVMQNWFWSSLVIPQR